MQQKLTAKLRRLNSKRWLVIVGVLILITALAVNQLVQPRRSVAAYCKVYKAEKVRIAKLPGNTYPSLLFGHQLSDAGEFVTSLQRLEKAAPDDIRPDVHTLKSLYQKLKDDPSQMVSVSFAADSVDKNVSNWTSGHCQ